MIKLHQTLLYLHIIVGALALVIFWLPMLSRKGSAAHVKLGKVFAYAMYTVSISGIIMCVMVLFNPIAIHFQDTALSGDKLANAVNVTRMFSTFLLALSLLVFTSVKHGILVLKAKQNRHLLKTFGHLFTIGSLGVTGVVVLVFGALYGMPLLIIFGALSAISAINILRYIYKAQIKQREWVIEHLGALIGAGIGVYTAFFAVGGRHLLAEILPGYWQLLPWVAPGVIGSYFIIRYQKTVERQFNIR